MSYQVIARKYRPQKFADVVGQEHVTQTLANAVQQSRIAHAYLFCGPRGTGKTTIARIFAKCLNCTGGPRVDFDDNDPKAREIAEGRSLDVIEIDGASNNGVEQVRELRETCKYAPASSKFKIYIIDEVHMLTTQAFNALLKTLEEPPAHVKFLFATTDPEKVLPTILSRCQRFDLRRIPTALIVQHLREISKKEGVEIEDAALYAIARGADGGMRDAESTLDQLISFCGARIVESDVLSMFGLTSQSQILDLAGAVLDGNADRVLRDLNDLARGGKDLGRLLSDVLAHFRNLLVYQISGGDMKLLEVSEAEAAALVSQTNAADPETLTRIMDVLTSAESRLRDTASRKILLEVAFMKAIEARNAVSIDSVLKQLNQLRTGTSGGGAPTSKPAPAAPAAPVSRPPAKSQTSAAPAPAPAPRQEMQGVTDLLQLWKTLLEEVRRARPLIHSYLLQAHPVCFKDRVLTIGFDPEFADQLSLVDNTLNHQMLQHKLHEMGLGQCHVKFIQAEAPEGWEAPAQPALEPASAAPVPAPRAPSAPAASTKKAPEPAALNKADFKNDPLIQKALEIFKGQIVEIRG